MLALATPVGRLLEDGAMERHGVQYASLNWPENELGHTQTPFDLEAQRNFILRDENDEGYTPAWIADIGDAREGLLEIVNGPGMGRIVGQPAAN